MEKYGMDRRFRIFGAGLLKNRILFSAVLLFLVSVFRVWAQTDGTGEGAAATDVFADAPMEVVAVYSPQNPLVRRNLVVTILADHPVPAEVSVHPPRIPAALMLERVRTEARQIERPGMFEEQDSPPETSRWTAVEFLFTSLAAGMVEIEPIEVRAPGKMARTGPIRVRIYEDTQSARRYTPVLRWENPPAVLTAGEEREIVLALSGWDPALSPPEKIFGGRGPRDAILEELPFGGAEKDGTIRYRCRLIPLAADDRGGGKASGRAEESSLVLDAFSLPVEGHTLEVPRLVLKVTPARNPPPQSAPQNAAEISAGEAGASSVPSALPRALLSALLVEKKEKSVLGEKPETEPPPFPPGKTDSWAEASAAANGKVFPFFRKEYDKVLGELEKLWGNGSYARVLAELRRNERENFAGPSFSPLRRELEKNLCLSATEDESWQFWKIPLAAVLAAIVFFFALRKIYVTSGRLRGYRVVISFSAGVIAALLLIAAGKGAGITKSGSGKAVLETTLAYRVPDLRGTVNARFEEGQPVHIRSGSGEWLYVESADGRAGWIPAEAAIPYSR